MVSGKRKTHRPLDRELHITVVAGFGDKGSELDVSHEVTLVKAALLYADRVTLASPKVAMLATIAPYLGLSEDDRIEAVLQILARSPKSKDVVAQVRALQRKPRKTVEERLRLKRLQDGLRSGASDMGDVIQKLLERAGVTEIDLAMRAGVLDLDGLGMDESGDSKQMVGRVAELLANVTAPKSTTYPLLDDDMSDLLGAMVREGVTSVPNPSHLAQSVGARWIGQMEAYPFMDMQSLLGLRHELQTPLARYRRAIIEITDAFRFGPLDAEFEREAGKAFTKNVVPELEHLAELAEQKHIAALLRDAALSGHVEKGIGAVLGLVGASEADLPQLVGGAVGVGVAALGSMVKQHREVSQQQRRNAYFLLYELNRRSRS